MLEKCKFIRNKKIGLYKHQKFHPESNQSQFFLAPKNLLTLPPVMLDVADVAIGGPWSIVLKPQ
jgi:hypothetical protein